MCGRLGVASDMLTFPGDVRFFNLVSECACRNAYSRIQVEVALFCQSLSLLLELQGTKTPRLSYTTILFISHPK